MASEDLVVRRDDLGRVGHAAYKLHGGLAAHGEHAKANSTAAGTDLAGDGFATGAALKETVRTWSTQVKTLMEACAHISNHLDHSSKKYGEEDARIATSLRDARNQAMTVSRINDYFH
ncbi:hypothetical protein [Streptomyces sp. URMC 123]|uniref:hypothetical protein n=1 Tax=Streptomyces sp. URMC 123 TaxID=3423403 RepID=UPI003F1E3E49